MEQRRSALPGRPTAPFADGFQKILLLLRNHTGVDFSLYKSSTIQRRITRRMVLNKQDTLTSYADFLHGNAKELDALYSDTLISVTSFFRNPDSFEVLQREVWPALLRQPVPGTTGVEKSSRPRTDRIDAAVPGIVTGRRLDGP